MKDGAGYAKKIKKLFGRLKRAHGDEYPDPPNDLVEVLVLAILSRNASDRRARAALNRILDSTVDMNEFRVTSPADMPLVYGGDYPDAVARSKALSKCLNEVFNRENAMDLSEVAQKSKREARDYFESLPGSSPFVAGYVVLWGLKGHGIPVDDHLAMVLRKEGLVDAAAEPAEIQSFLERHVSAADGKCFATLVRRYAASKAPRGGKPVGVKSIEVKPVEVKSVEVKSVETKPAENPKKPAETKKSAKKPAKAKKTRKSKAASKK